jgi:hypothetical protein
MSKEKTAADIQVEKKLSLKGKMLEIQRRCAGVVNFDSVNPHFKNKYASLETVLEKLLPVANEVGLILSQRVGYFDGFWSVCTVVADEDGMEVISTMPVINPKQDAQGFGSALSYAKRYSLMSAFSMVGGQEDDDAETAQGRPTGTKLPQKPVSTYQGTDNDKQVLGTMLKTVGIVDQNAMRNTANKCLGKKWDECELIVAQESVLLKGN